MKLFQYWAAQMFESAFQQRFLICKPVDTFSHSFFLIYHKNYRCVWRLRLKYTYKGSIHASLTATGLLYNHKLLISPASQKNKDMHPSLHT